LRHIARLDEPDILGRLVALPDLEHLSAGVEELALLAVVFVDQAGRVIAEAVAECVAPQIVRLHYMRVRGDYVESLPGHCSSSTNSQIRVTARLGAIVHSILYTVDDDAWQRRMRQLVFSARTRCCPFRCPERGALILRATHI